MREAGRLTGAELQVAGNVYQAGDRVVTLAPSAHGRLVTSQRGQVTAVHPDTDRTSPSPWTTANTHSLGPDQIVTDKPRPRLRHDRSSKPRRDLRYRPSLRRRRRARARIRRHEQSPRHPPTFTRSPITSTRPSKTSPGTGAVRKRQAWAIDTGTPEHPEPGIPLEIED